MMNIQRRALGHGMTPTEVADRMNGMHISEQPYAQPGEFPQMPTKLVFDRRYLCVGLNLPQSNIGFTSGPLHVWSHPIHVLHTGMKNTTSTKYGSFSPICDGSHDKNTMHSAYFWSEFADQEQGLLPAESPEIHALLAKLQDVATTAGGNLEPEWHGSPPYRQKKATMDGGENHLPGWDRFEGQAEEGGEEERQRCVLEDFTPCSKSHLWKLMMSFYDRKGVESWSQVGITGCQAFVCFPMLQTSHGSMSNMRGRLGA